MSKNRILASLISNDTSKVKPVYTDSDSIVTSASLGVTAAAGTVVYTSADDLPATAESGDQALVSSTNRLYIYSGSGWYNIALINNTPYWSTEANSTYSLARNGTSTVVAILAIDSDGIPPTYSAVTDSNFDAIATISKDSDSGRVFTIIPIDSENGTATAGTGTVTFKASDGISLVSTVSTFNIQFTVSNINYTTFLAKADTAGTDNQVDASATARAITEVGDVTSNSFTPYHPGGYSTYFDGTGDYIRYDNAVLAEGTGDFTVEAWVYRVGSQSTNDSIFGHDAAPGYQVAFGSTNNLRFDVGTSSGDEYLSTGTLVEKRWYHVAYQRASGVLQGFLDGVSLGTQSVATNFTNTKIDVGVNRGGTAYFSGYLRDVRIVKGTAVYSGSGFTPPTAPLTAISGTTLLTCHAPYIADGSTNNISPTLNGNTKTLRFGPYGALGYSKADHGGSVYFDGTGDYLTTLTSADFAYGTGDFTIEAWVNIPSDPSNYKYILGQATVSTGLGLYIQNNVYKLYGGGALIVQSSVGYKLNVWEHIAISRSGTTLKMFLNGTEVGSVTNSLNFASGTSNGLTIGRWLEAPDSQTWLGHIADVRVVKGTAVYTSNFAPPTAPLTAISGTSLLTLTNKDDIWDASGHYLTKIGGVAASNTQRKFTTSSAIHLNGNDRITLPISEDSNFGTGDFTIEWWQYWVSQTGYGTIYDNNYNTSPNVLMQTDSGVYKYYVYMNALQKLTEPTAANASQWYHYALVRYNGTVTLYRDGAASGTPFTFTASVGNSAVATGIGARTGANSPISNSYIQDFRITKGLARYTSTFTPPTTEFDG